ncbi:MAG: SRPBCC domain-containing protein [Xanthobacteraceae bacterium]
MLSLVARRMIPATPDQVFRAWTDAGELQKWFGPKGVSCIGAEVDLRVGGRYRIGNQFTDGRVVWIAGEFERIERPRELVYTWNIEPDFAKPERVVVRFEQRGADTEVVVVHERIPDAAIRDRHAEGWDGCFDGLERLFSASRPGPSRSAD